MLLCGGSIVIIPDGTRVNLKRGSHLLIPKTFTTSAIQNIPNTEKYLLNGKEKQQQQQKQKPKTAIL